MPEAPYTLGVVLWQTGRGDQAVPLFRDAIARRADYAEAHYMLGTVLRQLGDGEGALREFRETIRINPALARGLHLDRPAVDRRARQSPAPLTPSPTPHD